MLVLVDLEKDVSTIVVREDKVDAARLAVDRGLRALEIDVVFAFEVTRQAELSSRPFAIRT